MSNLEQTRVVWVGNVESWMDEVYLDGVFRHTGNIAQIRLLRDKDTGAPRTYAFLEYASHAEADNFIQAHTGKLFHSPDGHPFRIGRSYQADAAMGPQQPEVSVFVGNLDPSVTEGELKQFFSSRYKSVIGAKVAIDFATGASKHFGFVRFTQDEEAQQAMSMMQGVYLGKRPLRVKPSTKGSSEGLTTSRGFTDPFNIGAGPHVPSVTPGHRVSFSGLDLMTTEADVLQLFKAFGVVYRGTAYPGTGAGIVEFRDYESAEKAVQYLRSELQVEAQFWDGQEAPPQACQPPPPEQLAGAACAQPAVTNTTMARAQTQLAWAQREDACGAAASGLEHFQALLWDPCFVHAFEHELAQGPRAAALPSPEADGGPGERGPGLPWLLQDRPELFEAPPSMDRMNEDFLPPPSGLRAGGRRFPSVGLLPGLAPGVPPLSSCKAGAPAC